MEEKHESVFPLGKEMNSRRTKVQCPEALPMTPEEVQARGWDEVDIVFVTGDAYVDHPSFATGLLARVLEADGFRVAILSQPDWHNADPWKKFGRPRLGFCVSAGNMDSMINHYTANRKVRNDDAYSPGGVIGLRPDRATLTYCQRAREAWPGIVIVAGGVEASLRRFAHYDYWSDKVRRSILLDSKASLISYGMGERSLVEIFRRLDAGEPIEEIRNVRGTAYRLGKTEDLPEENEFVKHLPSCEEVMESKPLFAEMTRITYQNLNPSNAKTLVQEHGEEAIVVNPPAWPLTESEMDEVYDLPFTRHPHPSYGDKKIPAFEVIQFSVPILRGCFGGCAFCSLTAHQGKFVQCRSEKSIVREIEIMTHDPDFRGTISDIGGPTANMYRLGCNNPEMQSQCRRPSCLHPKVCPNLNTDHSDLIHLMRKTREVEGVKQVLVASGVRTDLALQSPDYIRELIQYHIGGHLKTAPEHVDPEVLDLMQKPPIEKYEEFCDLFASFCESEKKDLYLVPYLIAGLPGCDYSAMVSVAEYLKKNSIRPEQVQDFIPAPFELATCMYYTELNPLTGESVYVPNGMRQRRLQHALLMYYKPEFYHDVKSALKEAHREDLIGTDPECLIPPYPPKIDNLRQTSRIKRLKRKTEAEKEAKEQMRQHYAEEAREKRLAELRKKREACRKPGYRSGAREFGRDSDRRRSFADGDRPRPPRDFNRDNDRRPFAEGDRPRPPRDFNRDNDRRRPFAEGDRSRPPRDFNRDNDRRPREEGDRPRGPRNFSRDNDRRRPFAEGDRSRPPRDFNRDNDRRPREEGDRPRGPRNFNRDNDRRPREEGDRPRGPRNFSRDNDRRRPSGRPSNNFRRDRPDRPNNHGRDSE